MFVLLYYISISCGLWYWIIIIAGNILRSVNDIPIGKLGIPLYQRSLYPGFTKTIAGQMKVDRYTGKIVIPKITQPRFHCIDIESWFFIYLN